MQLFEFKTAKQIWPPIIPRDMSIFEPIPHNPRYSADWWKYRDEEAAARRAESELVNARYERQAKGCWLDPVANGWRLIGAANMSYRELLTKAMFTESLTPSPELENRLGHFRPIKPVLPAGLCPLRFEKRLIGQLLVS